MKIKVIEDPDLDCDLTLTCKVLTPEIESMIEHLKRKSITVEHRGSDLQLDLRSIIFFETYEDYVYAHLCDTFYKTRFKLYELLELLPANFIRISKSCIVNLNQISGYDSNLTSSRTVRFYNTEKLNYASRMYFHNLKLKLNERSL